MSKYLITSIALALILLSQRTYSQSAAWKEGLTLVQKDINQIKLVKKQDLPLKIRLFELYCEKLNLLLQYENELSLKSLDQPVERPLKIVRGHIAETNRNINNVSSELEKKVTDKNILGQIYYFKALNNYSQKKHQEFYQNLLKAERYCQDKEVCYRVFTLLADYYYNEKLYSKAIPYYQKTLSKTNDPWLPKNYFNMSWCYLKLEQFDKALGNVIKAHQLSKSKQYFKIGNQLNNSVLLFFAYSKRLDQGLNYIMKNGMNNFDNLLLLASYVFEHGQRNEVNKVFSEIKKLNLTAKQKIAVFNQKIKYYRNLTYFQALQSEIRQLPGIIAADNNAKKDPAYQEMLKSVLSYNGLLQETLKINTEVSPEQNKVLSRYIQDNFKVLRSIDPANSIKYYFYEGETFFILEEYSVAIPIYLTLLKQASSQKDKNVSNEYLKKTFDSLFKSLEFEKNNRRDLVRSYRYYLHFYPKAKKSHDVYQRLIAIYIETKKPTSAIKYITLYNKNLPQYLKVQQNLFKEILNVSIKERDTVSLKKMRDRMKAKFLSFGAKDITDLNVIIAQIYFNIILEKSKTLSINETLKLYDELYAESQNDYELQHNILLKKLSLEEKSNAYEAMAQDLSKALTVLKASEVLKYQESLNFYLNRICQSIRIETCYRLSQQFRSNKIPLDDKNKLIEFKAVVALKRFNHAFRLVRNEEDRDYLFQNLLVTYPNGESPLFAELGRNIAPLSYILEQKFWTIYFTSFDFTNLNKFYSKIHMASIQQKLKKLAHDGEAGLNEINLSLPTPPQGTPENQVTFEVFSSFLKSFSQEFQSKIQATDKLLSRTHVNFLLQYTDKIISELTNEHTKYHQYDPKTSEEELNTAIKGEMLKLITLITQTINKYQKIQHDAVAKMTRQVGADFYTSYPKVPYQHDITEVLSWESI